MDLHDSNSTFICYIPIHDHHGIIDEYVIGGLQYINNIPEHDHHHRILNRWTLAALVLICCIAWKLMCVSLRRQRAQLLASFDPVKDAHKLLWYMYSVEFPFLTQNSLEFGTLQTLAIPSITAMLNKSKYGLKQPSKRAAETNILVSEFIHHHVDSDRGSYAIQRLNAVHAQFKICNRDFVYVLCLNVLNPIRFAKR